MFGRLTNVRIKAAEDAFEQGRFDDAFDIAVSPDLAGHGRMQALRGKLGERYLRDGQDLMMDRQFSLARENLVRAAQMCPDDTRIADWIRRADEAIAAEHATAEQREAARREARGRMEAGSLIGAAAALKKTPMNDTAEIELNHEIARRAEKAASLLTAARKALGENRLPAAVSDLLRVRAINTRQDGFAELESRVVAECVRAATTALNEGRLDRAHSELRALQSLGESFADRREIEEAISLASRAAAALQKPDYQQADQLLARLIQMAPKVGWIANARKQLRAIDENRRALFEGPLGMATSLAGSAVNAAPVSTETLAATPNVPPPPPIRDGRDATPLNRPDEMLPRRLLLRIDGVGSFLLIRGDRIAVGRAGPGASADIQLLSDLSERHADIVRAGEDYFVVSQSGVELAGNATDHALLQDGDRIRLSRRVRMTFARPSLKSTAATLELGEGVRMPSECRRIVLWSGPILMGATRECHIRLAPTLGDFVLAERGGRVFFKAMRGDAGRHIALGEQVNVGELSLRVTDWNTSMGARGTALS